MRLVRPPIAWTERTLSAARIAQVVDTVAGLGDQALASTTNFATLILLARAVTPGDFGSFTLVYSALLFSGVLQGALVTQPHNVIGAGLRGDAYVRYTASTGVSQMLFTGVALSLAGSAALIGAGTGSEIAPLLVALVPAIGAWQLQEFSRRVLYTEGRVRAVLVNDLLSYGGQAVLIVILAVNGLLTGPGALYALAVTSALGAAVGALQIRKSLSARPGLSALKENLAFGKWLAGAETGYWSSTQIYLYLVAAIVGPAGVGIMRAAQLLFGPLNVLLFYSTSVLPSRFARAYSRAGGPALRKEVSAASRLILPVVIGYSLFVVLLGSTLLQLAYGNEYIQGSRVLVLFAAFYILITTFPVLSSALRALRRTRRIFLGYLSATAVSVSVGWLLVRSMGVEGAVAGMTISALVVTAYCWIGFVGALQPVGGPAPDVVRLERQPIRPMIDLGNKLATRPRQAADLRLLTWSYLLPADLDFQCIGAPRWFEEAIEHHGVAGGQRALVQWGTPQLPAAELDEAAAVVLFNPSIPAVARLASFGFTHVRHFAVIPDFDDPRWFIPLESGAAASAAFRLYAPYRIRARVQYVTARAAARLGGFWYRKHVYLAQRSPAPLETLLRDVFGTPNLLLGLASGSPTPPHKPVFIVLDRSGRTLGFCKVARSAIARQRLHREADALVRLRSLRSPILAPQLLFKGELDGTLVTVQSALEGSPGPETLTNAHENFLQGLVTGERKPASATQFVRSLRARLTDLPLLGAEVSAFERLRPVLDDLIVESSIVHGDFAPWNIRRHGESIAAFDWERATLDGLPHIDAFHHELQVGILMKDWTTDRTHKFLRAFASARSLGVEKEQMHALEAVYLLDFLTRALEAGQPGDSPLVLLYRQLLEGLMTIIGPRFTAAGFR